MDFSNAWIRASIAVLASAGGAITLQPKSLVHACHCAESPPSSSAITGILRTGGCATALASRLIVPQARTNFPGQLLNFVGLFERGNRKDVTIIFLQTLFEFLCQIRQPGSVLEIVLMFGLEDFIALQLPIGQAHVALVDRRGNGFGRALR